MGPRRKSRSRSRRKRRSDSESEEEDKGKRAKRKSKDDEEQDEEELNLEQRVALLEVENETLKAENRELRKKLVDALRRKPAEASARAGRGAAAETSKKPGQSEPASSEKKRGKEEPPKRRAEPEPEESNDNDSGTNAVLLVNAMQEAYNESVPNNIPPEKRLPLVQKKLDRFMECVNDKVQILDLASGKPVIKDLKTFIMRYSCVFRESGAKLKCSTTKRFYYDASGRATYCLDYETHDSLVTAQPGTPPDGKLGVREPRTEHLVVLYEEKGGKITRMWLKPDLDKAGPDPKTSEDALAKSETFKAFEAKIAELKGGNPGPRIFHNYHEIPTVGG